MDLLILFIIIVAVIIAYKKQEHKEYNQKVTENREFELCCVHKGNQNILDKCGEENFIKYFGKDQFEQIKNGTDTKIVEMLKEYKEQM